MIFFFFVSYLSCIRLINYYPDIGQGENYKVFLIVLEQIWIFFFLQVYILFLHQSVGRAPATGI